MEDKTKHTLQLSCVLHTMTTRRHMRDPAIVLHVCYSVREIYFSVMAKQNYQFEICITIFKNEMFFFFFFEAINKMTFCLCTLAFLIIPKKSTKTHYQL